MPFCAARMIAGSASFSAASAVLRSPPAIASSTLRTRLRICDWRDLLISVRRAILRTALRAEEVLGMATLAGGRPLARRIVVRLGIHKSKRRRAPRRQHGAYSRHVPERQREARSSRNDQSPCPAVQLPLDVRRAGRTCSPCLGGRSELGRLLGRAPQAVIGGCHHRLLACGKRAQRGLDPRPGRIAVDMGDDRLDARDQRLAIQQLADANRAAQPPPLPPPPPPPASTALHIRPRPNP